MSNSGLEKQYEDKKLKVAWFASAFVGRRASGTAQTALKIVEHLLLHESNKIEVILILKNETELGLVQQDKVLSMASKVMLPKVYGNIFKSSRQFYKYSLMKNSTQIDILHFSVARLYPFYWIFPAKKFFCTFHAGGEITVPQDNFVTTRLIYNIITKLQWRKLDRIFADSEFGINEIEKHYKIPRQRISLVHLGTDHLWDIVVSKIYIDKSKINIAVIGRWQNYKNVHSALKAFIAMDDMFKEKFHIYLIGKSNQAGASLVKKLIDQISSNLITCFDYLPDSELKYLYQNVNLVIHPSVNEGFGLPAFEAFGEGAPIAIHSGLPADYYLGDQPQVTAIDMTNLDQIIDLLSKVSTFERIDASLCRKFLESNCMTWDQICRQYVDYYLNKL